MSCPGPPLSGPKGVYWALIFWALMRRRILFLRHFQRMWPRFFQTRELRFIQVHPRRRSGLSTC